ncbi:MAG TPA: succinate dehydrogenase assembly factor 2, partial [Roseobacter sp.]|nr:succinate dehydrogenase assembly factor 2 [Roseobacter sp.]
MTETYEYKVKRLHMRSMRRGIKEMDLILPSYASQRLSMMDEVALSLYDEMLS